MIEYRKVICANCGERNGFHSARESQCPNPKWPDSGSGWLGTKFEAVVTPPPETPLTKREQFAAMAMRGICSFDHIMNESAIAKWSVSMADALIAELAKENK